MKKQPATNRNILRSEILLRIRDASFPDDFFKFTGQELEAAGLIHSSDDPRKNTTGYHHYVLLATQAKELRKQRDSLACRVEVLEHYDSPLWDAVWNEPCPIKAAELRCKAEEDDTRINEQRRKQRDPLAAFFENLGKVKRRDWEFRDKNLPHRSFRPALWHEPMSVMDYHKATWMSRRTIQNLLYRLDARPIAKRGRPNEAARYNRHTNHALLCDWLTRYVKDKQVRRGWLARTLVHCQYETPTHYAQLYKSIRPVLESLGIRTTAQRQQFVRYLGECTAILHPPPPPPTFLDDPLSLSSLTGFRPTPQ